MHCPKENEIFEVEEHQGVFKEGYQLFWCYPGPLAKFSGVDMGGKMTALAGGFDDGPAIIKVAGYNGWSSRGDTQYFPPRYLVGTVHGIDDHGNNGTFRQCFEIRYTRKHLKIAKAKALELLDQLKNKEGVK